MNKSWTNLRIIPLLVIVSLLLASCASPAPAVAAVPLPAVTAVPSVTSVPAITSTVTPTVTPTDAAPQSDDVWDRIVANNKIVVGTSWDYPPFSSVDSKFQVVGFDIALMKEIGRRLNIPIDFQNFSFEGLPGALQLNQIDLAAAAISITPERAAEVTFSPVYYINETAVLARNDMNINMTDLSQLAGYRIGVQAGTTYETLIQTQLVDTGLLKKEKLLSYRQADEAVRDLLANRVDLVVIGKATASFYNDQKLVKLVGNGFGRQDLALAMRLGTPRLHAEITRVLDAMLLDGTILALIQQYSHDDIALALPTAMPTSMPAATAMVPVATLVPPACLDGMKFVSDVSFPDDNMKNPVSVRAGEKFVKTWRVQNSGSCTWTPQYNLSYAYGNVSGAQMNGQPVFLAQSVLPGQTVDLSVTLTAPTTPMVYQGFWQIHNAAGRPFGQTIWVGITSVSTVVGATATVAPPVSNVCQVTLYGPTAAVKVHDSFDASWTVKNLTKENWATTSTDYRYISGSKMHEQALYDLPADIKAGESARIIVDMTAPATPGVYSTVWALVSGSNTLCTLTVTVNVLAK